MAARLCGRLKGARCCSALRTVKPCDPDARMRASSPVQLPSGDHGSKVTEAPTPGRSRSSRHSTAQGRPGYPAVPVVTPAPLPTAQLAALAGICRYPALPAPSSIPREHEIKRASDKACRETAQPWPGLTRLILAIHAFRFAHRQGRLWMPATSAGMTDWVQAHPDDVPACSGHARSPGLKPVRRQRRHMENKRLITADRLDWAPWGTIRRYWFSIPGWAG